MPTVPSEPSRDVAASNVRLPADLTKLRQRFVAEYPTQAARADMLAHVPGGFRHILGLRLELDRADALPRHFRDLAEATLRLKVDINQDQADAVDRLVAAYAAAAGAARWREAQHLLPALRRFFTESQIVELALTVALAGALSNFDVLTGIKPSA